METRYLYSDASHRDIDVILTTLKNIEILQYDIRVFYEKLKDLKVSLKFMINFEESGLNSEHYKELFSQIQ